MCVGLCSVGIPKPNVAVFCPLSFHYFNQQKKTHTHGIRIEEILGHFHTGKRALCRRSGAPFHARIPASVPKTLRCLAEKEKKLKMGWRWAGWGGRLRKIGGKKGKAFTWIQNTFHSRFLANICALSSTIFHRKKSKCNRNRFLENIHSFQFQWKDLVVTKVILWIELFVKNFQNFS